MATLATIIVPAHNEATSIGNLLQRITHTAGPDELDVVVVCNGCTDGTAEVAKASGRGVRVLELPAPSKALALRRGFAEVEDGPTFFIDADVTLGTDDIRAMVEALTQAGVLAVAPERDLDRSGMSRLVRWYYDVWERLPQ